VLPPLKKLMLFCALTLSIASTPTGTSFAVECGELLEILGNPVARFADREKVLELSARELFTYSVGNVREGANPILNRALADAQKAGVEVIAIESEALSGDPKMVAFAKRLNGNGALFFDFNGKPVLALGRNIPEELAVHEIRHLNDFLKTTAQWQAEGMTREEALEKYREAMTTNELTYTLERNAIIAQLKHRYRGTGFQLDDPNLIERVIYPETSLLITKGLMMYGKDGSYRAGDVMDKAVRKALMIQRRRFQRLQTAITSEKDPVRRAEVTKRADTLKSVRTLYDQMFPPGSLDDSQAQLAQSSFMESLRRQLPKLPGLKGPIFSIDRE